MRKIKITTECGDVGGKMYVLWQWQPLFGWKRLHTNTDSKWIRELKNHLLLPDKIYTEIN